MDKIRLIAGLLSLIVALPVLAFSTQNEQIDAYLQTLEAGSYKEKETMLKRLQWSGLTAPRLYDDVARRVESHYLDKSPGKNQLNLAAYLVRALGYSGNEKYRDVLTLVSNKAFSPKLKRHARNALDDLDSFITWNKLIAESDLLVEDKDAEITSYMKMLSVDDYFVQRLAARAIFHENLRDNDLLDLAADRLKALYLKDNLDSEWQDTASWLCKAIGQSGKAKYLELLTTVADETPYRKIKKYAQKFIK